MKRSDRLGGLVRLQELRERRQRVATERVGATQRKSEEAYQYSLRSEAEAYGAYNGLHSREPFELDHRQLLAAYLTHAADRRLEADQARARAFDDYQAAIDGLQVETARTREMADQALNARRSSAAKQDDINLRTMRSLHAALGARKKR